MRKINLSAKQIWLRVGLVLVIAFIVTTLSILYLGNASLALSSASPRSDPIHNYNISTSIRNSSELTFTPVATIYLPLVQGSELKSLPLVTRWGQRNEYARFSPDNLRLGCWSTAIAQILYYHRLIPSGNVNYQCSTGYVVSEDFDAYAFDWSLFVNGFNENTSEDSINEVAKYIYFTSVAIQKDYGTGTYVLNHSERAEAVAQHYYCDTELYNSYSYTIEQLKQIIAQELDAGRPVMMHLRDLSRDSYHAVVIDACREENTEFLVHINMGWEGSSDGWYDFDSPILNYDDTSYKKIITVQPK